MQSQQTSELIEQIDQDEALGPKAPKPLSREDVKRITGDLRDIPMEVLVRGRIDQKYHFKELGPCGRKGCPQKHGWGYIVAIPGGRYVGIGHNCRDRLANPKWDRMVKDFEARHAREMRHLALMELLNTARSKRAWHAGLRAEAAACSQLIVDFRRHLQGSVLAEIQRRADKNERRVEHHTSISRSKQDAQRAILGGGQVDKVDANIRVSSFEITHLGDLAGLEVFVASRDPLSQWTRLGKLLDVVEACSQRVDDVELIRATVRSARDIIPWSSDLLESITSCRDFFADRNLDLVVRLQAAKGQGIHMIRVHPDAGIRVVMKS